MADAWTRPSRTARRGIGIWDWASTDAGAEPDVVLACAGDVPDRGDARRGHPAAPHLPELRVRVVNVVDLMRLQDRARAPARADRPGVRRAVHRRQAGDLRLPRLSVADPPADLPAHNHANIHVRGYKEEGTTTTPFDMVMLNDLDRFHLVADVIDRVPGPGGPPRRAAPAHARRAAALPAPHHTHGLDAPDVVEWVWQA